MPEWSRPIPPVLGRTVTFQLLDTRVVDITHEHDSTLGTTPGDWGWLEDNAEVEQHLASYANALKHPRQQRTGIQLYGQTQSGHSVVAWLEYKHSFRVEVHHTVDVGALVERVRLKTYSKRPFTYRIERKAKHFPWRSSPEDNRLPKKFTTIVVEAINEKQSRDLFWSFKNQESDDDDGIVVEIHEDSKSVPTDMKALIECQGTYGDWFTVPVHHRATRQTSADYELVVSDITDIQVDTTRIECAPISIAAVDIECYSSTGRFPNAERDPDCITMIGVSYRRPDATETDYLFRLSRGDNDMPGSYTMSSFVQHEHLPATYEERVYATEHAMLLALRSFIIVMDVRCLVTMNGDRFDWKYILRRALKLNIDMNMYKRMGQDLLDTWHDASKGMGKDKEWLDPLDASADIGATVHFDHSGRIGMDLRYLMQYTMKGVKRYAFKSYSLNYVAEQLIGVKKIEMPAEEMFRIWREGNGLELRTFCDYCVVDVRLLFAMMDKELFIQQLFAMANCQCTSLHGIVNAGPFQKIRNATIMNASKLDLFIGNDIKGPNYRFKGATVLDPVCGPHGVPRVSVDTPTGRTLDTSTLPDTVKALVDDVLTQDDLKTYESDVHVATLDFASLYPSIMMTYIIDALTIILPGREGLSRVEKAHDDDPPVSEEGMDIHEEIIYEDDDPTKRILRRNRFIQNAKAPYTNGILPKWEAELKKKRKEFKRLKKVHPEMEMVYEARQLAMKISMNAIYGILKLIYIRIAESVAIRGRIMLGTIKADLEACGFEVVYGDTDSVMVKFHGTKEQVWEMGEREEKRLNAKYYDGDPRNVNKLEFEKEARFFLLLGKKAYFMDKRESRDGPYKMSSTGTCDVRRDRPAILTDITTIMGTIMSSLKDLPVEVTGKVVLEALRRHFEAILDNTHPIEKYVVTTTIRVINENTEKRAHIVLAKRLEKRDGIPFAVGDSVDVVQVEGPEDTRDSDNVAHPSDFKDDKCPFKVNRYLYFDQKITDQVEKMAKWYIPPKTLKEFFEEYDNQLKPQPKSRQTKKRAPQSHSIVSMMGADPVARRKRKFERMYSTETEMQLLLQKRRHN